MCVCVGGVGAYLPRLPLLLYPKGWIRVLIVTFDTCVGVCVCVFRPMICCHSCQKVTSFWGGPFLPAVPGVLQEVLSVRWGVLMCIVWSHLLVSLCVCEITTPGR